MQPVTLNDLPPYFYKYRSLSSEAQREFARQIIVENKLYWPSPLEFNDPFDCAPVHEMSGSASERRQATKAIIDRNMPNVPRAERRRSLRRAKKVPPQVAASIMDESVRRLMAVTGVCSLSQVHDNILMWSHYADSHRGICLRLKCLSKDGRNTIDLKDTHFEFALPVVYRMARPVIDLAKDFGDDLLEKSLLTKADFWSYEQEWRLIGYRDEPGVRSFPPECLDAVILGARFPDDQRALLQAWISERSRPTKIVQARFDPKLFRLNFFDVR